MIDSNKLHRILNECKTIAVVGLSAIEIRPSFLSSKYMQDHGYRIIPVNPNYDEILGEKCYPDLRSIPEPVDMVDLFQRADRVLPFVEQAIEIKARVIWMQLDIINDEAAKLASNAGLEVVMDHCVKIEYARLFAGLNSSVI
ncbi:MAG: putative CoA-binding protein [Paraglaciecola sp.]|jgi:predicted CoA-binding protein